MFQKVPGVKVKILTRHYQQKRLDTNFKKMKKTPVESLGFVRVP